MTWQMERHGFRISCISVGTQAKPTDYFFFPSSYQEVFISFWSISVQNRVYIHSFKLFQSWGVWFWLYSITESLKSILELQIIVDLFMYSLRIAWNRLPRGSFQENKGEYAYCTLWKCEVCEYAANQVFLLVCKGENVAPWASHTSVPLLRYCLRYCSCKRTVKELPLQSDYSFIHLYIKHTRTERNFFTS